MLSTSYSNWTIVIVNAYTELNFAWTCSKQSVHIISFNSYNIFTEYTGTILILIFQSMQQ